MSILSSAMNTGFVGIQNGMANAQQTANKINNATQFKTDPTTTIAEAAIELKQAETQVKASAQVITMANERITSLFDDFA